MKMIICFFLILTISVATEVKVYFYNGYDFHGAHSKPTPRDLFSFGYHWGDIFSVQIFLKIEDLNMSADLYVQHTSSVGNIQEKALPKKSSKGYQFFEIRRTLNDSEIGIDLEFNTTTGVHTRKQIVKGILLPDAANDTSYNDISIKSQWVVIEVDLLNDETTETTTLKSPPPNSVLLYVIPSVIVMSVIILVIYLSVKKHCHRNSRAEETMQLNTYATANEVVYADLSLVHGDRQPPRREEESPYAEIIGVINSQ